MAQHPTEETLNITRKFLGGEIGIPGQPPGKRQLPSQVSDVARGRAFGQQGARRRQGGGGLVEPQRPPLPGDVSLSSRFFDLPSPVNFAKTPQGQAILQRILGGAGRGGLRRF